MTINTESVNHLNLCTFFMRSEQKWKMHKNTAHVYYMDKLKNRNGGKKCTPFNLSVGDKPWGGSLTYKKTIFYYSPDRKMVETRKMYFFQKYKNL